MIGTERELAAADTFGHCRAGRVFPGGAPHSLWGALAWIVGILGLFVPLAVWRYRRMS